MWKIHRITAVIFAYGITIRTQALTGPESTTLTRRLSPTRSTYITKPFYNQMKTREIGGGLETDKIETKTTNKNIEALVSDTLNGSGLETDTNVTYLKTEAKNTNENIETLVSDTFNDIQLKAVTGYLFITIALAKMNLIGEYNNYTILLDLGSTVAVGVASIIFVKVITRLSTNGVLQARDSRKIIHMFSAPLFMIFWPIFSDVWGARLFAGMITFFQGLRLYLAGTKRGGNEGNELASAISRSGKSEEALEGPLIYTIVLFFTIIAFWRNNLSSIIVLSTMAAGDGAADIFGRRLGKNNKWFFNEEKSIAGSLAFFTASTMCSIALAWWFNFTGIVTLQSPLSSIAINFALISVICAAIELVPFGDDNWSVPISAALLSVMLL